MKQKRIRIKTGHYQGVYFAEPRVRNFLVWVNEKFPNSLPLPDSTVQRWLEAGDAEEIP